MERVSDDDARRSGEEWNTESSSIDCLEDGHLLEKDGDGGHGKVKKQTWLTRYSWMFMMGANILILCITVLVALVGRRSMSDAEAIAQVQAYSPVFNTLTPNLHTETFNGSLFNWPPSIYRADPSPEIDEEWNRISEVGWFLLTREDILALNKDPATRARASPGLLTAMNLPADGEYYYGQVDAFHQVHCLNVLRKHSYWDSYYAGPYGTWDHAHELHWTHISHCIGMLVQNIKCNADARILTAVWMEGQTSPSPDFNIEKKCGDFEGLLDWGKRKEIPLEIAMSELMFMENANVETLYDAPEEIYLAKGVPYPEGKVGDHVVPEHKHWYSSW